MKFELPTQVPNTRSAHRTATVSAGPVAAWWACHEREPERSAGRVEWARVAARTLPRSFRSTLELLAVARPGRGARQPRRRDGAVLLEVVLALVLFVGAAAVIAGALNASLEGVIRQRLSTHAVNLAITVLSELQIGLRAMDSAGPEPFAPPFEDWTWQLASAASGEQETEPSGLTRVEVIIRHNDPPLVYRLAQVIKLEQPSSRGPAKGGNL